MKKQCLRRSLACVILAVSMSGFFCACGKKKGNNDLGDYHKYLGDYYYDCSISAMVFETPEDEEYPGVMYREVTDLDALLKTCPIPVCLFFYSSMQADVYGIFACMEEITENYHDKVLIVAIDAMSEREIAGAYEIRGLPDAIIVKDHVQKAHFDGTTREEWSAMDLQNFVIQEATT